MKTLSLTRRYRQEKEFRKNDPIFVDGSERNEYIKNEIEVETDPEIKSLLNKQLFIS
jgi:hypothetical protein